MIQGTRFYGKVAAECEAVARRRLSEKAAKRRQARLERTKFAEVRRLIENGKLRAANKKLKRLAKMRPNTAALYQLEYELRRAEQKRAEERLTRLPLPMMSSKR